MTLIKFILLVFFLSWQAQSVYAEDVPGCGSLRNAYGPYDYTNSQHYEHYLPIVETAHFNRNVESLKGPAYASGSLERDLDYTLRAFPNHHRALFAIMRYREKHPATTGGRARSAECYLKRALRFKPDDGVVWMLYGIYNHRQKKYSEALDKYKNAEKLLKNNSELYYNMGLLYLDLGDIPMARKYADRAYKTGYPLPALREKLKSIDQN